jgi:hypothetical protein
VPNQLNCANLGQMNELPLKAVLFHLGKGEGTISAHPLESRPSYSLAVTVAFQPSVECFVHSLYAVLEDLRMDCSVLRKQGFHLHQIPFLGVEIGIVF